MKKNDADILWGKTLNLKGSLRRDMGTEMNFKEWLSKVDPDTAEEIYSLYNAVKDDQDDGFWRISRKNGMLFVAAGSGEHLLIASDKAKNAFLDHLLCTYCDGFDDIDSWYAYMKNMENPNA